MSGSDTQHDAAIATHLMNKSTKENDFDIGFSDHLFVDISYMKYLIDILKNKLASFAIFLFLAASGSYLVSPKNFIVISVCGFFSNYVIGRHLIRKKWSSMIPYFDRKTIIRVRAADTATGFLDYLPLFVTGFMIALLFFIENSRGY